MLKIRIESNKSAERDAIRRVQKQMQMHAEMSIVGIQTARALYAHECPRCKFPFWERNEYAYLCGVCSKDTSPDEWLNEH